MSKPTLPTNWTETIELANNLRKDLQPEHKNNTSLHADVALEIANSLCDTNELMTVFITIPNIRKCPTIEPYGYETLQEGTEAYDNFGDLMYNFLIEAIHYQLDSQHGE